MGSTRTGVVVAQTTGPDTPGLRPSARRPITASPNIVSSHPLPPVDRRWRVRGGRGFWGTPPSRGNPALLPRRVACVRLRVLGHPRVGGGLHLSVVRRCNGGRGERRRCADRCAVATTGTTPFCRGVLCAGSERGTGRLGATGRPRSADERVIYSHTDRTARSRTSSGIHLRRSMNPCLLANGKS